MNYVLRWHLGRQFLEIDWHWKVLSVLTACRIKMFCRHGPTALKTTTDQYKDFKDKFLLDASKSNLHPGCVALLSDLLAHGIVAKLPDTKIEINDLFHTLSGPVHYSRKPLPNVPGIYIGGDQPMTSALAMCMARLQGEHVIWSFMFWMHLANRNVDFDLSAGKF